LRLETAVAYAPGTLTAIAYKGGKEIARDEFRTAGAPARHRVDRGPQAHPGGRRRPVLHHGANRGQGREVLSARDNLVHFRVAGAGEIAAVDNGNAATIESFQAPYRQAFNGLALLIVRSTAGRGGAIDIVATAEGLSRAISPSSQRRSSAMNRHAIAVVLCTLVAFAVAGGRVRRIIRAVRAGRAARVPQSHVEEGAYHAGQADKVDDYVGRAGILKARIPPPPTRMRRSQALSC